MVFCLVILAALSAVSSPRGALAGMVLITPDEARLPTPKDVFASRAITRGPHIDLAGREAGNMRLFEATGVGAFLLTDFKDNLDTLFAPDREVAVWRSIEDCLGVIGRMIGDDNGRAAIARAGHARTMAQHTYRHRASEILGFVAGVRANR